jgi:hypothetical protein
MALWELLQKDTVYCGDKTQQIARFAGFTPSLSGFRPVVLFIADHKMLRALAAIPKEPYLSSI